MKKTFEDIAGVLDSSRSNGKYNKNAVKPKPCKDWTKYCKNGKGKLNRLKCLSLQGQCESLKKRKSVNI